MKTCLLSPVPLRDKNIFSKGRQKGLKINYLLQGMSLKNNEVPQTESEHNMTLNYSPQLNANQMYSKSKELPKLIKSLKLNSSLYFLEEWKKVAASKKSSKSEDRKLSYWQKKDPCHVYFSSILTVSFNLAQGKIW